MKINTPDDFKQLLHRAVRLEEGSKYFGCKLLVRSKIPLFKKIVELKSEELEPVWPGVKHVLDRISNLRSVIVENNGLAILTRAFTDRAGSNSEPFWIFESGFTLHRDVTGIRHDTKTGLYYFACRDGRFLEADLDAIAHNHGVSAQFLVNIRPMLLSPSQVVDAMQLCGVPDRDHRIVTGPSDIPDSVLDILTISKTKLDTSEVYYTYFDRATHKPIAGTTKINTLEGKFPRITQALLAFNTMPFSADSTRANLLRKWWSQVEKIPLEEPVIFVHPTSLGYLYGLRSYSRDPSKGAFTYSIEKLKSVMISGDHARSVALSFGKNDRGNDIYQSFAKDNDQFVYLGLDKVISLFETLDVGGADGALMLRAALRKQEATPNLLNELDSDTPFI